MRKYPPSWLNTLIWFSLIVSSLGLFIGLVVFATTKPMIDMAILEFDSYNLKSYLFPKHSIITRVMRNFVRNP